MEKFNTIGEILDKLDEMGVTAYEIAQETHLSEVGIRKVLEKKTRKPQKPTVDALRNFLQNKLGSYKKVIEEPQPTYQPNDKSKFKSRKRIPYYDIDASGGDVTMFSDNPETPAGFLEEFFDDCDFAMNLWGHSMFPDYSNGEVIVLKQIFDKDQILFGEAYLIVTDELRTVKYIRKSDKGDDFIKLVPKNEKYFDPIDLHKEKVTQIFLVKGKIVRNA